MNENERYKTVEACKYVHKVIKNAPLIATLEFIEKYNIHIYAIGEEYANDPNDKFYKVPRDLGMCRVTRRTKGIGTSDILKRIIGRGPIIL